ncbi:MAG: 1-acyl-sn-glycerol-3-phosphate acyltransferase [Proteobacteria bacterium]|jgi:1-acyl-sn-glycerol-3-phosphate acyltransferase|nr:1-acyl-sn-glycerol-3-phosphate acyltransferase [Pseudomonadota bacterium]MCG6934516.1 1-acyl-sn-glycerol-3-phosphate acyltransferase [Pseudomonadota bacterium]
MGVVIGISLLLLMGLGLRWLFRKADAANQADWGSKWIDRLDGLNRLFLRHYHSCQIETVQLPDTGPALVVANHISGLDPLMMAAACRRPLHFIIATEEYNRFGLRWLFRLIECIPVDRSSRDDSAFRAALAALREGKVVGLFPGGRIHLPEEGPARLKRGVARLSRLSGAPVYPLSISGVRMPGHVLPAVIFAGRARVQSFPPIDCANLAERSCLEKLGEVLHQPVDLDDTDAVDS